MVTKQQTTAKEPDTASGAGSDPGTLATHVGGMRQLATPLSHLAYGANGGHARKSGMTDGLDQLVASIRAHGLLIPLLVRKARADEMSNGASYVVIDGNRRVAAIQQIYAKTEVDPTVPIIVREVEGSGMEESLATFVLRAGLHPIEEYEAFAYLNTEDGLAPDEIAKRFGIKEKAVLQRLALGNLSPKLRDLWRKGQTREDEAQAFTLLADHKAQDALYEKLKKNHQVQAWSIRREILGDSARIETSLGIVGEKEFEAAGGKIVRDLFGDQRGVSDFALLTKLLDAKIDAKVTEQTDKHGWSWAMRSDDPSIKDLLSWRRLYPEKGKTFSKEQKAKAGAIVGVGYRSSLDVECGYIKPGTAKLTDKDLSPEERRKKEKRKEAIDKGDVTVALGRRLDEQNMRAIKAALVQDGTVIHDPLPKVLAGLVAGMIRPGEWGMSGEVREALPRIRDTVDTAVMLAAMRNAFDAADYFASVNKTLALAAITEMEGKEQAKHLAGKPKGEIAKYADTEAGLTGWLPVQLRPKGYSLGKHKALAKQTAKGKAKPKAKTKRRGK